MGGLSQEHGDLAKAEVVTRLQQQPLLVLIELLEHSGELVTREQLIARLWPKGIVDFDASLNTAVRKLRLVLNDDPEHPRYIETIPRRGYRFLMQVEPQPQTTPVTEDAPKPPLPSAPPEARDTGRTKRRPYVIGVLAIAALAALAALAAWVWGFSGRQVTPSLVVLPFVDMTTDQKDRALCNGITEELTVRLARLQNVHVVARTSSFAYQGKAEDIRAIGKSLGATHAIEGSVRRDGDALRVTVQLVSSMDGCSSIPSRSTS